MIVLVNILRVAKNKTMSSPENDMLEVWFHLGTKMTWLKKTNIDKGESLFWNTDF